MPSNAVLEELEKFIYSIEVEKIGIEKQIDELIEEAKKHISHASPQKVSHSDSGNSLIEELNKGKVDFSQSFREVRGRSLLEEAIQLDNNALRKKEVESTLELIMQAMIVKEPNNPPESFTKEDGCEAEKIEKVLKSILPGIISRKKAEPELPQQEPAKPQKQESLIQKIKKDLKVPNGSPSKRGEELNRKNTQKELGNINQKLSENNPFSFWKDKVTREQKRNPVQTFKKSNSIQKIVSGQQQPAHLSFWRQREKEAKSLS